MLRHEIGGILTAQDLRHREVFGHNPLLNPQVLDSQVPKLAEPMSRGDPYRSARIAVDTASEQMAKVVGQ